jgi:hypothetical protein
MDKEPDYESISKYKSSFSSEYQISRVNAAMKHEGHPLTEEEISLLHDCICGKVSAKAVKERAILTCEL